MLDLRPVGYVIGLLTATLGALMLFPLALDFAIGNGNWPAFAESALITTICGILLALACANGTGSGLSLRQSFVLTTGVWIVLPVFGALPLMLGSPNSGLTDAIFESMSGMTTTGTTVFVGLDDFPPGANLWRAMLHWLGGLGIVVVALIFLPVMKVGGMQFFRAEGFDTLGKVLPRALDISAALVQIYVVMTLACAAVFWLLGMNGFEAVIHSLSTVSTGGFSNRDTSFTEFSDALHYTAAVFMVLATLPFIRFIQLMQGHSRPMWEDSQVRAYLRWTLYAVAAIMAWRIVAKNEDVLHTVHDTVFNVISIFSGTGFTSGDMLAWGHLPFVILLIIGLIGGCTSSTGCSVKVFRYLVMFQAIRTQIRRILMPYSVQPVRLDGRTVDEDVINSVIVFFTLFVLSFGILAIALSMAGLPPLTALTAAWTSIADIGPVWGPMVGPTGAVGDFPASAKWLMIAGMLVGRLELLSVYVLFTMRFWAR
ncbi:TrkH family potassium uptake protein [Gemmobacter sp.]|uniref:TrkH family potassium uptake protein n=1 Tax=Gemmobacter sp. TaxID=1898957 RepID=UPI002AFEB228|nr:TrkH family potassium uptake protein [Gemmobacter sp.]